MTDFEKSNTFIGRDYGSWIPAQAGIQEIAEQRSYRNILSRYGKKMRKATNKIILALAQNSSTSLDLSP